MNRALLPTALGLALFGAATLTACEGCHTPDAETPVAPADAAEKPSVRLFLLSTVAGALEPCGCSKDQLGGVDHLAAYLTAERGNAGASLVLGAGPLLFLEPFLDNDLRTQSEWKAEALAQASKTLGLGAWAPGANDWAAGSDKLATFREVSSAALLAANLDASVGAKGRLLLDAGGLAVGVVGLSLPAVSGGPFPEGVKVARPPVDALKAEVAELEKAGARILVALTALPRGEALRLAEAVPELDLLLVGKPSERGEGNDAPKSPVLVGSTLVVETANHLQTVSVVDLFVKDDKGGPLRFSDGTGIERADELVSLTQRIRELEARINGWEGDQSVSPLDVAARKKDLEKLRADKASLEAQKVSVTGSYFRYRSVEVRGGLGVDPAVHQGMLAYYKRVNEHNKLAFADRKPEALGPGQAGYVGVEACTACHEEERKVWDGTSHAKAYETLQKDFKEYNLECVSCHVTGYGRPGGSTVTHNEKLVDVGCEVCHGPGSNHVKSPEVVGNIKRAPELSTCVSECHHPPHVEGFDAAAKVRQVLGPGHGM